ncbi:hypothetical protein DSL72_003151 [Monilinia vaccinii-corymbosi]|uniref:Prefoldin subunit 4 n=1 Tax=Monilinia vaccinii-corymbosi TaxID=61207 RepID=A0A8A3NW58_9HELO|nr:hypothetical protein DSL72_003151 [Monilinia vaccinii-corymbosi]
MQRRMLSKEAEAAVGADEVEVRREDQDNINRFSRLRHRELGLVDELKLKNVSTFDIYERSANQISVQKEKEDLDDVSGELELADEDEPVLYKIGDSFISLPLPEVQELLTKSAENIEEELTLVEEKLGTIREEMSQLKVELYARFGRSINLES